MIKVYKIGGALVENEALRESFCASFAELEGPKVLVHGGGVEASALLSKLGIEAPRYEGRRVTDAPTLKVVTMVYAGWCNKSVVACLQKHGCNAIGLSGCDGSVIKAERRPPIRLSDGSEVDFGFVGDVSPRSVDGALLLSLMDLGLTPVLSPVNHDGQGRLFNTNADTVASSVAAALGAELCCRFELDGVYARKGDPSSLIETISEADFEALKASGAVSDGMIPKIKTCLDALRGGAAGASIGKTRICL